MGGLLGDHQMGSAGGQGWLGDLMVKPGNFCHSRGDAVRKCCHLTLQLDEEGV